VANDSNHAQEHAASKRSSSANLEGSGHCTGTESHHLVEYESQCLVDVLVMTAAAARTTKNNGLPTTPTWTVSSPETTASRTCALPMDHMPFLTKLYYDYYYYLFSLLFLDKQTIKHLAISMFESTPPVLPDVAVVVAHHHHHLFLDLLYYDYNRHLDRSCYGQSHRPGQRACR
jgi:hypothetical protein